MPFRCWAPVLLWRVCAQRQSDFDSAIPRFESWRPSQPAESLPQVFRYSEKRRHSRGFAACRRTCVSRSPGAQSASAERPGDGRKVPACARGPTSATNFFVEGDSNESASNVRWRAGASQKRTCGQSGQVSNFVQILLNDFGESRRSRRQRKAPGLSIQLSARRPQTAPS